LQIGFGVARRGIPTRALSSSPRVYDQTIQVLKSAVRKAKLGREDELGALKRLDGQSRRLGRSVTGPSVEALIGEERRASFGYGGRSVFGWEPRSIPVR
jgi:hypothetical protein